MPSSNFILLTILGSGLATWLGRIMPFVILKKFRLSAKMVEFLSFVPISIMSVLWFEICQYYGLKIYLSSIWVTYHH